MFVLFILVFVIIVYTRHTERCRVYLGNIFNQPVTCPLMQIIFALHVVKYYR